MTKFYDIDKFELAKDYNNGMRLRLIAKKHGISLMTVNRYIRVLGIYKTRRLKKDTVQTTVFLSKDLYEYIKFEKGTYAMSKLIDTALRFYISHMEERPKKVDNPFSVDWVK